jgi:hypothetical protein
MEQYKVQGWTVRNVKYIKRDCVPGVFRMEILMPGFGWVGANCDYGDCCYVEWGTYMEPRTVGIHWHDLQNIPHTVIPD